MRPLYALGTVALAGLVMLTAACVPRGPHPMENKAAPAFVAETTDGGEVTLAQHRGQDIVVLDFWASWCPPCREGLPAVASLAAHYKDQPVAVYAVNQGEDLDTASEYMAEEGLDLTVLMDESGDIGALYGVRGIPQTVIIDRDGQIVEVHVGFRKGDERGWRRTIDSLLSK